MYGIALRSPSRWAWFRAARPIASIRRMELSECSLWRIAATSAHTRMGVTSATTTPGNVTTSAQRIPRLFPAAPRAGVLHVVADQHGLQGHGTRTVIVHAAMADNPFRELQFRFLNIRCAKRGALCLSRRSVVPSSAPGRTIWPLAEPVSADLSKPFSLPSRHGQVSRSR